MISTRYEVLSVKAEEEVFCRSLLSATVVDAPFRHLILQNVFSGDLLKDISNIRIEPPFLSDVSGRRELHNDQRHYFDENNQKRFHCASVIAQIFKSERVVKLISDTCGADLYGTYLRLEYAQDPDGFYLEPHTDLGVKKFTCLIYLSENHEDLGTDLYASATEHVSRTPFAPGTALIFVPSENTWHGFEKRKINGVRKSLILNYVTSDWRASEQLSFSDPVCG